MLRLFIMLCVIFTTTPPTMVRADTQADTRADTPPVYVAATIALWRAIMPADKKDLFNNIHFKPVTGDAAPLARYSPSQGDRFGGFIEIGQNFRQYRRDYVVLSSNQDMAFKPDFDQYMSVLTLLSLANESAHYLQDKNGSLSDFYKFYNHGKTKEACALYGLQQYVSDVVMMESAMRLEKLFLGQGSVKGLNALRIALEKNDLRDDFEEFREGIKNQDITRINSALHIMRTKRNDANMSGLKFCDKHGDALIDQSIIDRATEPATNSLSAYRAETAEKEKVRVFNQ